MFAARMTDPTMHGGFILYGDPTVIIGGLPAARQGDPHFCPINLPPLPVHLGGPIAMGSTSVIIGGAGAARQFDLCACAEVPFSLPSAASGPGPWMTFKADEVDWDNDGVIDQMKFDGAVIEVTNEDWELFGYFRHKETIRIGHGKGEAGYHRLQGEAAAMKESSQWSVGDSDNPLWEMQGESIVGGGDAFIENMVGTDGRRYGYYSGAGASAYVGKETKKITADAVLCPILAPMALAAREYLGINAEITVGGSAEHGVGGEASGGAFYDSETGRVHVMGKLSLAVMEGLGAEGDISIGVMEGRSFGDGIWGNPPADPAAVDLVLTLALAYYNSHRAAAIPNSIAMGCPTVIIGG